MENTEAKLRKNNLNSKRKEQEEERNVNYLREISHKLKLIPNDFTITEEDLNEIFK